MTRVVLRWVHLTKIRNSSTIAKCGKRVVVTLDDDTCNSEQSAFLKEKEIHGSGDKVTPLPMNVLSSHDYILDNPNL